MQNHQLCVPGKDSLWGAKGQGEASVGAFGSCRRYAEHGAGGVVHHAASNSFNLKGYLLRGAVGGVLLRTKLKQEGPGRLPWAQDPGEGQRTRFSLPAIRLHKNDDSKLDSHGGKKEWGSACSLRSPQDGQMMGKAWHLQV
jgi:hypothetical protein